MKAVGSISKWECAITGMLLMVAAVLIFQGLGTEPLGYPDEIKSAERSTSFLTTGDWAAVHMNHQPNFNKPPLQYWLNAMVYQLQPDKELAVRFVNGLFSLGVFMLTVLLAWQIFKEHTGRKWIIPLAVYLLLIYGPFIEYARIGILDMGATFFVLLVLLAANIAKDDVRWWILAGAAALLGTLQKTPLPFAVWFFILIVRAFQTHERRKNLKSGWLWGSLIMSLLIASVWPVMQMIRFGEIYFDRYVVFELTEMTKRDTNLGPLTYIVWTAKKWFVFTPIVLLGVVWAIIKNWSDKVGGRNYFLWECSLLALIYFSVMSCLTGHSHRYIFPVLPLLCIVGAWFTFLLIKRWQSKRKIIVSVLIILSIPSYLTAQYHYNLKRHNYKPFVPALEKLAEVNAHDPLPVFVSFSDSLDRGNLLRLSRYYGEVITEVKALHQNDELIKIQKMFMANRPLLGVVSQDRIHHLKEMMFKVEVLEKSGGIYLIKIENKDV